MPGKHQCSVWRAPALSNPTETQAPGIGASLALPGIGVGLPNLFHAFHRTTCRQLVQSAGKRCVMLLSCVGGLTLLACACAFDGFIL